MTGALALALIDAMKQAVDDAGTGEFRGIKALAKLHELGFEVVGQPLDDETVETGA